MKNYSIAYCVGFAFTHQLSHVYLLEKNRPLWQRGKLNGMGGKLDKGESAVQAMTRESIEEVGYSPEWIQFGQVTDTKVNDFIYHLFYARLNEKQKMSQVEDERLRLIEIKDLFDLSVQCIWDLPYTILMARAHILSPMKFFTEIKMNPY